MVDYDEALRQSIQGALHHPIAKFILWKYENNLRLSGKQKGYKFLRYSDIEMPELEHISPQTKNEKIAAGYPDYDEEFVEQYLNCLGNYLLISKRHNGSIGNEPFADKRATYHYLKQQLEVQEITKESLMWTKEIIDERHDRIVDFIMQTF
jgi:hypothetical protein